MNWRGYVVLVLIVLGIGGFFGAKIVADKIQEQQFRAAERAIEAATHDKYDITDIEIVDLAGTQNGALYIYLYGESATANPLTEKEFEAVDAEFMKLIRANETDLIAWLWIRPGGSGDPRWYIIALIACERPQLLASKGNSAVPAGCRTQQRFSALEARHLRWLNE